LCDFGVSGQLIDSMANSFVGTRSYMSPGPPCSFPSLPLAKRRGLCPGKSSLATNECLLFLVPLPSQPEIPEGKLPIVVVSNHIVFL
ncbi:hypothetical protein XENOCAPTIV_028975, partial [Xenoophorus captivus]